MAKYVTLYTFTDQGMKSLKDSPARLKAGIEAGQAAGMKVLGAYYTMGPYDLVVVSEADDEMAATAFGLSTVAQGNVKSLTMRAWDREEFGKIVSMMP